MPNGLGGIGLLYMGREFARGARRAAIRKYEVGEREKARKVREAERQRDREFQARQVARTTRAISERERLRDYLTRQRMEERQDWESAMAREEAGRRSEEARLRHIEAMGLKAAPPGRAAAVPETPMEQEMGRLRLERLLQQVRAGRQERVGIEGLTPQMLQALGVSPEQAASAVQWTRGAPRETIQDAMSIARLLRPAETLESWLGGFGQAPVEEPEGIPIESLLAPAPQARRPVMTGTRQALLDQLSRILGR